MRTSCPLGAYSTSSWVGGWGTHCHLAEETCPPPRCRFQVSKTLSVRASLLLRPCSLVKFLDRPSVAVYDG